MQIAGLIGSLRKESYNRKLFNIYREKLGDKAGLKEVNIKNFWLYNSDIEDKGIPEEVAKAAELIKRCDGLIFFSPEYNFSIPGVLKNAIDWLSRVDNQPFSKLPCAIVGASPGRLGTARMQYHLRQIGVTLDMRMMNKPEVMASQIHKSFNEKGDLTDDALDKMLNKHIDKFIDFINEHKNVEKEVPPFLNDYERLFGHQ